MKIIFELLSLIMVWTMASFVVDILKKDKVIGALVTITLFILLQWFINRNRRTTWNMTNTCN